MTYENLLLEQKEKGIYLLTLNRPKALNALNSATLVELAHAMGHISANPDARVLLITGGGEKAFVAGADISEMQSMSALEAREFSARGLAVMRSIETLPIPVIALVNGFCLGGGCELAMSCDFILCSERAVFGQPEVNLGVVPGFGGTQRLPRLVGRALALELILSARQVKAEEAHRIGLANHVYPANELLDKGLEVARTIASKGPVAVRLSKRAVQRGQDLDLDNACVLESELFGLCFSTSDQKEGMAAFVAKRPAKFQGK
jgi:enoyl-CoA hydratase